jgi:hypothetical protein
MSELNHFEFDVPIHAEGGEDTFMFSGLVMRRKFEGF